ncbi:hypothetical protein EV361DRAFT_948682 [Lentinula raphanica]|uniref:Uncharacterized protein n=1 Tax=Lentinula raphanica TaxID=153919 RepID=A0AA38P941_9AGAR|nr:hypothetical protein F5878DRAFT_661320 [Lentinula raphanica]KAJ3972596.1 hypothetical protein EV361DRAFT_948682 [Lentinula raphanica]
MIRSSRRVFITFFAFLAAVGNITQVAAAPTGSPGGGGVQGTSPSPSHPNKPVTAIYEEILLGKVVPEDEYQAGVYARYIEDNIDHLPKEQKEVFLHETEEERLLMLNHNMWFFRDNITHENGDRTYLVQTYMNNFWNRVLQLDDNEKIMIEKLEMEVLVHLWVTLAPFREKLKGCGPTGEQSGPTGAIIFDFSKTANESDYTVVMFFTVQLEDLERIEIWMM